MTYRVYEDREDLAQKDLKGVVCAIKPEEVRERIKNLDKWETWEDLLPCPYNLHNFLMLGTEPILFTMIDDEGKIEILLKEEEEDLVKELIYGIH